MDWLTIASIVWLVLFVAVPLVALPLLLVSLAKHGRSRI